MSRKLLPVIILLTLSTALTWFAGTAHSDDDDYYYSCYAPDGTYYDSEVPCGYDYGYYDYYDAYPPAFGFDYGGHRHYRDRDFDSRGSHGSLGGHSGGMHGGGMHGGGMHGGGMHGGGIHGGGNGGSHGGGGR